jgi:hypothetical protein
VLSYILSALSVARHAVALTLVAGAAATTMVAGSVDQIGTQPQRETRPLTSLAPTTRPQSSAKAEATLAVTAKSAMPETTRPATSLRPEIAHFAPKTEPTTASQKPTANLEALVKDCLTTYAAAKTTTSAGTSASEACRRAIEALGLTSTQFWTRFGPKAQPSTPPVKPSTSPSTSIEALVKDCFAKYTAAKESATGATAASEACHRAIEASGLTATEFWATFGTPQAAKPAPKPTSTLIATAPTQLVRYCLTLHAALRTTSTREQVERATTVCDQAIAESRLTPTEFWAKLAAYR